MTADLGSGGTFGPYRIESLLGRGGMSVVYLAEDTRLGRRVAIKVLASELAADDAFRTRFVRESQIAAGLEHPNIVPVYEAGETEGKLFIAMRYVRGTDLRDLIVREGPLDPERTIMLLRPVASSLDAAHRRGLVHRDVKPANILIAADDREEHVYLSDFGLTKHKASKSGLTGTGQFMGTIDYVAPEQIKGEEVDGRTDVYSLACVLYECLSGRVPFAKDSDVATLFGHIQDPPPKATDVRETLPAEIDDVIASGMAKSREERPVTCSVLIDQAARALGAPSGPRETPATPPSPTVVAAPPSVLPGQPATSGQGTVPPAMPPVSAGEPSVPPSPPVPRPATGRPAARGPAGGGNRKVVAAFAAAGVVIAVVVVVVGLSLGGDDGREPPPEGPIATDGPSPTGPPQPAIVSNPASISIPEAGQSDAYPSTIEVSEFAGPITDVNVTVSGFSHAFAADVDMLVVGPTGQAVVLVADVDPASVNGLTLTFDDEAAAPAAEATELASGALRPVGIAPCCLFEGDAPAPAGPFEAALSAFDGTDPNGTWELFVFDDAVGDFGVISGGWSIEFGDEGGEATGPTSPTGSTSPTGPTAPTGPAVFSRVDSVQIPETGQASPYPSVVEVSGLPGVVADANVSLFGLTHGFADDVDILLVGPSGDAVVLMADTGGFRNASGVTLTFDDDAPESLPADARLSSGIFRPTSADLGFEGDAPAPPPPHGNALSVFNGTDPNGTWELFVFDDAVGDAGEITFGWSLEFALGE